MSKIIKHFIFIALFALIFNPLFCAAQEQDSVSVSEPKKVELKAPIPVDSQTTGESVQSVDIQEESQNASVVSDQQLTDEQKAITESKQPTVKDVNYDVNSNEELTKKVVPDTASELEKLIIMFAQVMAAVVACTIIIYFLLLFVKRFFHTDNIIKTDESYDIRDLSSPSTNDEAVKSFLDKTSER